MVLQYNLGLVPAARGLLKRARKLVRPQSFVRPANTAPRVIEIVGLAGSGKTTLIHALERRRRNPSFWATKSEMMRAPDSTLLRGTRADPAMFALLKERMSAIIDVGGDYPSVYRSYLASKRFFDTVFLHALDLSCHVVEDEGFVYTYRSQIAKDSAVAESALVAIAPRHGLVFISCTAERAVERLLERARRGGKVLPGLAGLSKAEMLVNAEEDHAVLARTVARARAAGLPVLEIAEGESTASAVAQFEAAFG